MRMNLDSYIYTYIYMNLDFVKGDLELLTGLEIQQMQIFLSGGR